ncbi:MAG: hypothetical protein ACNA7G_07330, partial [Methylobacter sp.]
QKSYKKADILMISDGDCALSENFMKILSSQKNVFNCSVYSVLCAGLRMDNQFSDEVVVL